ncbi:hypothetical protein NESM_000472300 [Novymonas esmeraldas]|uniref:Uncharacterized protein n=1 Tax=Novymonas esmeraldas TaxID=1808958 RepID=A0AAW0EP81_9TRYP
MFSSFSSWVASATDAVKVISDQGLEAVRQTGVLDALESAVASTAAAGPVPQKTQLCVADMMVPPSTWSGSEEEWAWCVSAALRDPNTCAITPAAMRADAALWANVKAAVAHLLAPAPQSVSTGTAVLTQAGNTTEASTALAAELLDGEPAARSPAADLVQYVIAHHDVYTVRSDTVPRFASDNEYWLNLGWRLNVYRHCVDANQLLTLMRTLSQLPQPWRDMAAAAARTAQAKDAARAEPRVAAPQRDSEETAAAAAQDAGTTHDAEDEEDEDEDEDEDEEEGEGQVVLLKDNTEYWHTVRRQYDVMQEKFGWLREMGERARKEMDLASGNVKLLGSLLQRGEASTPLGASVFDSCQYHKVKLSRLLAEVCAAPEEHSAGTTLDTSSGAMFHALVKCNDDVKAVLEAYSSRSPSSSGSPKGRAPSPPSPAPATAKQSQLAPRTEPPSEICSPVAAVAAAASPSSQAPQPAACSSPVEVSAAFSRGGDHIDDDSEESFEAKLPWSTDE